MSDFTVHCRTAISKYIGSSKNALDFSAFSEDTERCPDTQHNYTQHFDTQHKRPSMKAQSITVSSGVMLNILLFNRYAECHCAEFCYAECRGMRNWSPKLACKRTLKLRHSLRQRFNQIKIFFFLSFLLKWKFSRYYYGWSHWEKIFWGLYYKTLRICNFMKMDRCRSKLVSSGWDQTNTLAYYGVCALRFCNDFKVVKGHV